MTRFIHHLRGNHTTRTPGNILVFDTETFPHPHPTIPQGALHKLRLWCATTWRYCGGRCTRQHWHQGTTAAEFWELIYSNADGKKPLYVFSHNLGFDCTVALLWRELEMGRLTMQEPAGWRGRPAAKRGEAPAHGLLVLDDPPTIIETWVKGTRRRVIWLDTLNWWRTSLESLAAEFGLEKRPLPPFDAPDEAWLDRCRQDVEITAAAVRTILSLVQEHDCGVFKYTIAAQALAAYRHRFMQAQISIHVDKDVLELERKAYRGGEVCQGFCGKVTCETPPLFGAAAGELPHGLAVVKGPVHVFDVQAMYPSVMRSNLYPCRWVGKCGGPSLDKLQRLMDDYFCVAYVGLESPEDSYPARWRKRSVMGVGKFETQLCGPELARAVRSGHVKYLGWVAWYDQCELFTEFVDYFWDLRSRLMREGRPELAAVIKTLMVALPGKFGQRANEWPDRRDCKNEKYYGSWWGTDPKTGQPEFFRSIGDRVQLHVTEGESDESFPLIAGAVTSYGRERMRHLRSLCGRDAFLYQDTDSVHCLPAGAARLQAAGEVIPGAIGKCRLEGVFDECQYRGIKDYTLDGLRVLAGVKRNAEQCGHRQFSQLNFQRLPSIISAPPADGVTVRPVVIQCDDPLVVGRVDAWGFVWPVVLDGSSADT